jgi:hypothetical protein
LGASGSNPGRAQSASTSIHTSNKPGGLSTKPVESLILHVIYFTPFALLTASARGCDSFVPGACLRAVALSLDAAVTSVPDAVLPFAMPAPVDVLVASVALPAPAVRLAVSGPPVVKVADGTPPSLFMPAVPPAPFGVPTGAVAAVSVALAPVVLVAAVSVFGPQAERPIARMPAKRMLVACFMIVTPFDIKL